jgi:hypothetical protein
MASGGCWDALVYREREGRRVRERSRRSRNGHCRGDGLRAATTPPPLVDAPSRRPPDTHLFFLATHQEPPKVERLCGRRWTWPPRESAVCSGCAPVQSKRGAPWHEKHLFRRQIRKADEVLSRLGILDVAKAFNLVHRGKAPWNNNLRVLRSGKTATSIMLQLLIMMHETLQSFRICHKEYSF